MTGERVWAMLKAVVAGLLSLVALPPAAQAQVERSMDRGDWRRDRAERPRPMADVPRAPRPEGGEERPRAATRGDRPAPGGREEEPRGRFDERWRDGGVPRARLYDDRDGRPDRPVVQDRTEPPARARAEGAWRSERADRAEPRRRDRFDRPPPPAAVWRSERVDRPDGDRAWRSGRADRPGWDRAWRGEPRYDWSRYRDRRPGAFRLPRYYAPYGWDGGYRRFGPGMRVAPVLFAPGYWIDDPWSFRLPDAEDPYRWIRYYDDALLVDVEEGEVVDVIHGIFG